MPEPDDTLKPITFRCLGDGFDQSVDAQRFVLIGKALDAGNWGDLTPEAVQWYVRKAEGYRHTVMHALAGVAQVWNGLIPRP